MKNINLEIAQFIESVGTQEIYSSLCSCGAITMGCYGSNSAEVSFKQDNAPYIKPTNDVEMCGCNHCCNGWGLDINNEEY